MKTTDPLSELSWRGLLHQSTDESALREHLAGGPRRIYAGFDPTADSLTIGNLVPIMALRHFQRAGHAPVVIMGGGTGLIGDPSGKSAERQLMSAEQIEANVASQRRIFERLLGEGSRWHGSPSREAAAGDHSSESCATGNRATATILNNVEWLGKIGYLEALRDIGKHFSVNAMIQRDSVRDRLHGREQGISYTEFSYAILQAYDFLHLYCDRGVTVQLGGSDQWGNIVAGVDLIRRVAREESFGLTAPLVTKADGGKFGKTESGAIWLTAERTSPYAYFQFWLNADDADLPRFLRLFTELTREEIEALEAEHAKDPGARIAHRALARHATTLLHGESEAERAEAAAGALFTGDVASLDMTTLDEVFAGAPSSEHSKAELAGEGVALIDLLPQTSLAKSKREAKEFLTGGAVSVNGTKADLETRLTTGDLLHGRVALLRRGKKHWHATRWA